MTVTEITDEEIIRRLNQWKIHNRKPGLKMNLRIPYTAAIHEMREEAKRRGLKFIFASKLKYGNIIKADKDYTVLKLKVDKKNKAIDLKCDDVQTKIVWRHKQPMFYV